MKNLFNNFMVSVLSMAHEDPPTGNGGNNGTGTETGTGTGTGGNNTEDLKNDTGNENNIPLKPGEGSAATGGGGITDDGRPRPDVGVGVF